MREWVLAALLGMAVGAGGDEISGRVAERDQEPRTWGGSSVQLQRPAHVFFDGRVRPWEEAVLHVSSEAVVRGLNVFEGLKGYWQENGEFGLRSLGRHYERMSRSARLLHIPVTFSYDDFVEA